LDLRHPGLDDVHVGRVDAVTVGAGARIVDLGPEEHIVDLSVEVDAAEAGVETTGHPSYVSVLEEVACCRPVSSPANEEDHLFATSKIIDDCSGGRAAILAVGSELSNLPGCRRISDLSDVMEQPLRGHSSACLESSLGE